MQTLTTSCSHLARVKTPAPPKATKRQAFCGLTMVFKTIFIFTLFFFPVFLVAENSLDIDGIKLYKSYPSHIKDFKDNQIIFQDGTSIPFDDFNNSKNYEQMLESASLKEQMLQKYIKVLDNSNYIPSKNESPGRIRSEEFFKKMYGSTEAEVKEKLVEIKWMPKTTKKTVVVTSINDVDKHLKAVSRELDNLPPKLKAFVNNPSGGFYWRTIAKTDRLSMHSFGIAIDINVKKSNYWLWDKEQNNYGYKNKIPLEIVKIFEKHGFIWGGRWHEYDTMHFEYRPELL